MSYIKEDIKKYISENGKNQVLIHSDILYGFNIKFENRIQILYAHINELLDVCKPLDIWMPSFNYDFFKSKPYDVKKNKSQVGVLSEYFRGNIASWRSSTPVFNFSGTGINPEHELGYEIDPFNEDSLFGFLYKNKGLIMHYGSGFHTSTFLHYVERISGRLIYRYDKVFYGKIIDQEKIQEVKLIYHVRPLNTELEYDWQKIESDLLNEKLLTIFKEKSTQIILAKIEEIVKYWLFRINNDPFYFLDTKSKGWAIPKYEEINRRFLITDFE